VKIDQPMPKPDPAAIEELLLIRRNARRIVLKTILTIAAVAILGVMMAVVISQSF
jgi:hypothetical protein